MKVANYIAKLGILISMLSCQSGDKDNITTPTLLSDCQVKSYDFNDDGRPAKQTYIYDNLGRPKTIKNTGGYAEKDIEILYDTKGLITKTTYFPISYTFDFTYDSNDRLVKKIERNDIGSTVLTSHYFYEYNNNGYLARVVEIPQSKYGHEKYYKGNWEEYVNTMMTILANESNGFNERAIMNDLERSEYKQYDYDIQNRIITMKYNREKVLDGIKFERTFETELIATFDGKKSPYNSKSWKLFNLIISDEEFSDFGNVIEKSDPSPNSSYSISALKLEYSYNELGLPIKAIVKTSNTQPLIWEYTCK